MRFILQDIRYCVRSLLKSPGFTAAAILCLALGIGATTAIFSVVRAVLLKPLPYKNPAQLVRLYTEFPTQGPGGLSRFWTSPPEYALLKRDLKSWQDIEAWVGGGANLSGGGTSEPIRVNVTNVTGGMLQMLGVPPITGRLITPDDDATGAPRTAVISSGFWQRAFGGDRSIIGRTVEINGRDTTIVGVMPADFQFPAGELTPTELWRPLQLGPPNPNQAGSHYLSVAGRLNPGVTVEQARDEMKSYVATFGAVYVPGHHSFSTRDHPLSAYALHDEVVGGVRRAVVMLFAAVGFVLLIACVNVANLLLARTEARRREIAVRQAIGAGKGRLIRQLVTEGVLLSFAGAAVGLLLAYTGLHVLTAAGAESIPRANEVRLDPWVLALTMSIAVATGIFFGVAPILALSFKNISTTLKAAAGRTSSAAGANHFRRALVIAQLAMALVLLIGNGLMVRAFWKLLAVNPGLNPDKVLTLQIALPQAGYSDTNATLRFWAAIEDRVRALPGVRNVATVQGLPPLRPIDANDTDIENFVPRPGGPTQSVDYWQFVGNHYFETMGVRLMGGRTFNDGDGAGTPLVVVINRTMAETFWPGQSAIGHRVRPPFDAGPPGPWYTVVGVVDNVKNGGLDKPAGTEMYMSIPQLAGTPNAERTAYLAIKTSGDPMAALASVRGAVRGLDASLPISAVRTMDDILETAQSRPRFLTLLLSLFSVTALILAAVGIYGVISYSVAQRMNEFGIRIALGAKPSQVLSNVLKQGAALALIGTMVGVFAAAVLTRFLQELLFGVNSLDLFTFAGMTLLLLVVTLAACYVPARRATKVDPVIALRCE